MRFITFISSFVVPVLMLAQPCVNNIAIFDL